VLNQFRFPQSRRALTIGFGVLLALIIVLTLLGLTRIHAINRQVEAAVREQALVSDLVRTLLKVNQQREQVMHELFAAGSLAEREAVYERYKNLAGQLFTELERLNERALTDAERTAVQVALNAATASKGAREKVISLLMKDDVTGAVDLLLREGLPAQDTLQQSINRLIESKRTATLDTLARTSREMQQALLLVAIAGAVIFVLGIGVARQVMRRIRRADEALHRAQERAEVTLHSIGDGVITTDASGRIEYLNPVAEQYTGWSSAEATGKPLDLVYRVVDDRTKKMVVHGAGANPADAASTGLALSLLGRQGNTCLVRESHAPIRGRSGNAVGQVIVFHDVGQIEEMAQKLTWQASHDPLTGLVNRREFERRMGGVLESARSDNKEHAVLYMDLDNFKTVNDSCGHAAGDELLRQLATVMLARMRGSDTLARLGGDEFGALLESCPVDQGVRLANGMRDAVRDFRFVWKDKTFGVGVSIGLVPLTKDSGSIGRVLAAADATCYDAKNKGRDRVQVYQPKDGSAVEKRGELAMVSQINHAFELGNFRLYRQKIVALSGDEESDPHYEILVRMVDAAGRLIPPSGFMPAAERYNLMSSIERWVISTLVEYLHRQRESGALVRQAGAVAPAFYAVNLSAASIEDASFPDFLRRLLTRFNLPRGLLCFEVTETTAISNLTKAAQLMHELRAMGCGFALDDFGIGMSSFAYLKYLPVDYIKIDGVFVRDMAADQMDFAIVEAINRIAHILGLKTVAEFVEDEATLERLRALGVDFAQGYFISKPEALVKATAVEPALLESE
jgi:diguanylate cyclase (GGDEF)-like protein/PAS domain S-box-containing protein